MYDLGCKPMSLSAVPTLLGGRRKPDHDGLAADTPDQGRNSTLHIILLLS